MKSEEEIKQELRQWIIRNGKVREEALTDQTPIIEQRILSSIQILDLILFLEDLSGKPIDVKQLAKGTFRNIDAIYANFFSDK
jgi:acyl carrier protein